MESNAKNVSLLEIPELEDLITASPVVERAAGEALFHFGEPCTDLPLVLSGVAGIYARDRANHRITLYRLKRGDICTTSLSGLLQQGNYTAWATAETSVQVCYLCGEKIQAAIPRTPELFSIFLNALATALHDTVCTASLLACCPVDDREAGAAIDAVVWQ